MLLCSVRSFFIRIFDRTGKQYDDARGAFSAPLCKTSQSSMIYTSIAVLRKSEPDNLFALAEAIAFQTIYFRFSKEKKKDPKNGSFVFGNGRGDQ